MFQDVSLLSTVLYNISLEILVLLGMAKTYIIFCCIERKEFNIIYDEAM
jgi:hypothetical protein